jgi:hypothetical protein
MKASSSSGAWGRGFGEQIDGCGVGSRVNSAHITTADEQPSTRSEPAGVLCVERDERICDAMKERGLRSP